MRRLEGSQDNTNWMVLDTRSIKTESSLYHYGYYGPTSVCEYMSQNTAGLYEISGRWSESFFRYLRIRITANTVAVNLIEFWGMIGSSADPNTTISTMIERVSSTCDSDYIFRVNSLSSNTQIYLNPTERRTAPAAQWRS